MFVWKGQSGSAFSSENTIFCSCSILTMFSFGNSKVVVTGTIPSPGWMVKLQNLFLRRAVWAVPAEAEGVLGGTVVVHMECDSVQQSLAGGMEESEIRH